jgi:hypothetical protein
LAEINYQIQLWSYKRSDKYQCQNKYGRSIMGLIFNCGQKCEKVCVQVKKVFDACRKELSLVNQEIVVTNVNPDNPVTPLTYVGSKSSQTKATINNLVVTPLNNGNCARYSGNITIPLTVSYTDDNDKTGNGSASLTVPFDIILSLPPNSIMPYSVEAIVSASSSIRQLYRRRNC